MKKLIQAIILCLIMTSCSSSTTTVPATSSSEKSVEISSSIPSQTTSPKPTSDIQHTNTLINTPSPTIGRDSEKNRVGNANGNLLNHGRSVLYGDKNKIVFYDSNLGGGIYSINKDGSGFKKLTSVSGIFSGINLNVNNNYLYYSSINAIVELNLESQTTRTLYKSENGKQTQISWLYLEGNDIVFYEKLSEEDKGSLKILNLNTGNSTVVVENETMYSINFEKGKLYYSNMDTATKKSSIFEWDVLSNKKRIVKEGLNSLYSMNVDNGWIYYVLRERDSSKTTGCNCTIHRLNREGMNDTILLKWNENIHSVNVSGDWVYYVRKDDENYEVIARVNINAPEKEQIVTSNPTYRLQQDQWVEVKDKKPFDDPTTLNITGNWIFYDNVYGHNAYMQATQIE